MAYRRPGIEVVQQFQALTPALVLPTLPSCIVGPAFHLEDDGSGGAYDGSSTDYSYPNLPSGAVVDTRELDEDELSSVQKVVGVKLQNAYIELSSASDGTKGDQAPTAIATNAGDSITAPNTVEMLNATFSASDVGKVFEIDNAVITANDGFYIIATVVSATKITVINVDGTAAALQTDINGFDGKIIVPEQTFTTTSNAFSSLPSSFGSRKFYVELSNTDADDGKVLISSKTSDTEVELASGMLIPITGTATYKVLELVSEIDYTGTFSDVGGTLTATVGITANATDVNIPANVSSDPNSVSGDPVTEAGDVLISYRALLTNLADSLDVYTDLDSLEAIFGIGNVVPTNPYAYGVNVALNNTTTEVNATGLRSTFFTDEGQAYQSALEFLESEDVYGLCILTQNTTVHQTLDAHVEQQSVSTVGRERIGFINRKLSTYSVELPSSGVGYETTSGGGNGTFPLAGNTTFKDPLGPGFITNNITTAMYVEINSYTAIEGPDPTRTPSPLSAQNGDSITAATKTFVLQTQGAFTGFTSADIGRTIRIASSGAGNDGDYTIASVTNTTTVVVSETVPSDEGGAPPPFTFQIFELSPSTSQDTFITSTRHALNAIVSETELTLTNDPTNGFFGRLEDVEYRITDDLSLSEQATFLAGYATSFANRRLVSVWPDTCYASVSGSTTELPGFYLGCALSGLTAGLPSQQGFTNLSLTGFVALDNSNNYFSDTQLDTIAGGGNLVIVQEVEQSPVSVRHQLTTNTSSIQFQELSVTKNVDLVARFFRRLYRPYIGIYNITDALLDLLKSVTLAGIDFLKQSTAPRVGGVLRDGSISSLGEDSLQPDTVNIVIDINIPYPLNNIKVMLLV